MDIWTLASMWGMCAVCFGVIVMGTILMVRTLTRLSLLQDVRLALATLAAVGSVAASSWRKRSRGEDPGTLPPAGKQEHQAGQKVVMGFRRQTFTWTAEHIPHDVVASWEKRADASDPVFRAGMDSEAFEKAVAGMAVMPEWVDWELLDEGCRFFVQVWPWVFYSFSWALLGGFGAESASAVLLESRYWAAKGKRGRLDTWNRLRETVCWLFDVAAHGAEGFREGGASWKACLGVRYLHSRTRAHIRATGKWDLERWGEPINQAQLVGTLLGSSILLVQGMEEITGVRFPRRTREAFVHLWAVIGFLFGIDEDVNPNHSCRQAEVALESVFSQGIPVFPDASLSGVLATHICESVATGMREEYGIPATAGVVAAPAWSFLGRKYGAAIGLPECSSLEMLMGWVRRRVLGATLMLWFLPFAPRVFELLLRPLWVALVKTIQKQQSHCRFGVTCPMGAGQAGGPKRR